MEEQAYMSLLTDYTSLKDKIQALIVKYEEKGNNALQEKNLCLYNSIKDFLYDLRYKL